MATGYESFTVESSYHSPAYAAPVGELAFIALPPAIRISLSPQTRGQATFEEGFRVARFLGVRRTTHRGTVCVFAIAATWLTSCVDDASCPSRLSSLKWHHEMNSDEFGMIRAQ